MKVEQTHTTAPTGADALSVKSEQKAPMTLNTAPQIERATALPVRLKTATLALLELAQSNRGDDAKSYGFSDTVCEGAQGVQESRAALALCRRLLDALDADLSEAVDEHLIYLRGLAKAFESLDG